MKQYLPHGMLNVVKSWDWSSIGRVQNPLLASILDTFVTFLMEEVKSWNVLTLWTLNHNALLMVQGSKHTLSLPFGLQTKTRLWHQSVALLMSNFLMTPRLVILSISCLDGLTIACGIFLGGCTIGVTFWSTFNFKMVSLIVPMPSKSSGNNSMMCVLQSGLNLMLMSIGGMYTWCGSICFGIGMSNPVGNSFRTSTTIFLHTQLSSHKTLTKLKTLQKVRPSRILVSVKSVT